MDDELTLLKIFPNAQVARAVEELLANVGISAQIVTHDAGGAYPNLQLESGVRMFVTHADYAAAEKVLAEFDAVPEISEAELAEYSRIAAEDAAAAPAAPAAPAVVAAPRSVRSAKVGAFVSGLGIGAASLFLSQIWPGPLQIGARVSTPTALLAAVLLIYGLWRGARVIRSVGGDRRAVIATLIGGIVAGVAVLRLGWFITDS